MLYELSEPQAQFIREVLLGTRYEGNLQQIKQQSDLALSCMRALEPKKEGGEATPSLTPRP
ncbi:MAG: hypothetical protein L6R28_01655 [Planctomycetes bacterium]|nr:hypothetical protein [Planctomycetota bacterium]